MYKVLIAFNEFEEGQEIELKQHIAIGLITDGYVELIEEGQEVEKAKRGRKPNK